MYESLLKRYDALWVFDGQRSINKSNPNDERMYACNTLLFHIFGCVPIACFFKILVEGSAQMMTRRLHYSLHTVSSPQKMPMYIAQDSQPKHSTFTACDLTLQC